MVGRVISVPNRGDGGGAVFSRGDGGGSGAVSHDGRRLNLVLGIGLVRFLVFNFYHCPCTYILFVFLQKNVVSYVRCIFSNTDDILLIVIITVTWTNWLYHFKL